VKIESEPQETHAVAALGFDLVALLFQGEAVDLHHVVQHAGEHLHHFAVFIPVEPGLGAERVADEGGEVDRAQQAAAVRRQGLLAAGVGSADVLAPPVVVHLVHPVDQDETRLGEVVGGHHDHVPQVPRADVTVDLAGHQAVFAGHVVHRGGPLAPHHLGSVLQVYFVLFLHMHREHQRPVGVIRHGVHEAIGDQQRQVELAQAAILALGADEFLGIGMADVERAHLRAAAAAGGRHGEAHLVVDIHEAKRARRMRAGAAHIRPARTQGGEFVADAAAGLERQACLVHLLQDVVHGIGDGAADGAVDGAGGGLVRQRAGVRGDAAGGDGTAAQGPQEAIVPGGTQFFRRFHVG
jgi:hypothetical protein